MKDRRLERDANDAKGIIEELVQKIEELEDEEKVSEREISDLESKIDVLDERIESLKYEIIEAQNNNND